MEESSAPAPAQATTHDADVVLDIVASMARELGSQRASRQSVDAGWHLERDVGLDSLGRMELLSRIETATGWTLDEHAVMAAERVGDLLQCARIAPGTGDSPTTGAVPLRGEQFTGNPGKFVSREDTVRSFKAILDGEYDDLPEDAFYMVGSIEDAIEKAKTLQE